MKSTMSERLLHWVAEMGHGYWGTGASIAEGAKNQNLIRLYCTAYQESL